MILVHPTESAFEDLASLRLRADQIADLEHSNDIKNLPK